MTKKFTDLLPAVFTLLLILATAMMGSFDLMVQKWTAFICLIVILGLMLAPKVKDVFKSYTTPLFIAIVGYVIWNGISIFYAAVPKGALFEFTKSIAAIAVFFVVLTFTAPTKRGVKLVSGITSITTAFFAIVSIDAASNGPIAAAFKAFMGLFTDSMANWGGFEDGIRITGIFGNANTFAGFMALGVFLSIFLVIHCDSKKNRTISIVLLAINSLAYILLFSMGSLFMFLIACILMIATSNKSERLSTFILMAETAVITLVFTGVSLITLGSSPLIPLLSIGLNAVVLWCADSFVRQPITDKLASNTKGTLITGAIIVLLIVGYIIAALNITGPLTLTANETVMRALYLDKGEYKLASTDSSSAGPETSTTVRIITQSYTNLKVHTSTELYNGPLKAAEFSVPEDSKIVKLFFTGSPSGNRIEKVTYAPANNNSDSNKEMVSIKLDYKLLPAIAANRIQDLRANENSVQRMVFFQDGMKLFEQSPIIGHGLNGYEDGVASVQNFYYETKYVHNHYIETLCDLGIVGFGLFMSILVLCVMSIIKLVKRSKTADYKNAGAFALPVLAACIFQIFGQAITDVTWSTGPFLLIAFGIIALLIIIDSKLFVDEVSLVEHVSSNRTDCTDEVSVKPNGKLVVTGGMVSRIVIIAITLLMAVLVALNLYAHYKAASGNCTMEQMAGLTKIDKFESDDYKTTYIVATITYGLEENYDQANKFAAELTDNTEAVLNYLLPYYFSTEQDNKLFETGSIAVRKERASPEVWNRLFKIFDTAIDTNRDDPMLVLVHLFQNKDYYIEGLLGYYRNLQERNATYLDDAMLDAGNVALIGKLLGIETLDNSGLIQAIDVFSKTIFNSEYAVDANNDAIPDNVSALSGSTVWGQNPSKKGSGFDGSMRAATGTTMELDAYCVRGGEYTVRLAGLAGLNEDSAPRDISVTVDGQPLTVQYDASGAFIKVNLKGAVKADESKNIQAVPASTEKIVISFPTGAQMTKVTLKK
ncbi:O-antigen ligase family protein [Aminipila sp.]|uniref:O-antigen ligase family protein n=1 Tax=Aminipila sp. TaxID=2060095 RepID=UPI00289AAA66|nr:O-antigen ligase family protein [Aminipila sp.]